MKTNAGTSNRGDLLGVLLLGSFGQTFSSAFILGLIDRILYTGITFCCLNIFFLFRIIGIVYVGMSHDLVIRESSAPPHFYPNKEETLVCPRRRLTYT
jgi:hypothetical protein